MNKDLLLIPILASFVLTIFVTYELIEYLDYKSAFDKLELYHLEQDEKQIKILTHNKKEYYITEYYNEELNHQIINILFKYKSKYYKLREITYCDYNNIAIKENELYLHCIGRDGNIAKYTINNFMVEKESIKLKYDNIPKIYEYNIDVDKVDERYIYISDPSSNKKAVCNLITLICEYQ